MGLTVSVGVIVPSRFNGSHREEYDEQTRQFCSIVTVLNRELASRGLPPHCEPISLDERPIDLTLGPYGNLHALRRVAAHLWLYGQLPEPADNGHAAEDEALLEYQEALEEQLGGGIRSKRISELPLQSFLHLVSHGDTQGWYIPIDLKNPLILEPERGTAWTVGSTPALLHECTRLAGAMGMPANLDPRDPLWQSGDLRRKKGAPWRSHVSAAWVCSGLLAACRKSLKWNAVMALSGRSHGDAAAVVRGPDGAARRSALNGAS